MRCLSSSMPIDHRQEPICWIATGLICGVEGAVDVWSCCFRESSRRHCLVGVTEMWRRGFSSAEHVLAGQQIQLEPWRERSPLIAVGWAFCVASEGCGSISRRLYSLRSAKRALSVE